MGLTFLNRDKTVYSDRPPLTKRNIAFLTQLGFKVIDNGKRSQFNSSTGIPGQNRK